MTKLGILDQSPIKEGSDAAAALHETIALAKACERFGYTRYWVAEHHNTSSFAGSAPEILITRIANETTHIRVGSGGIMLPHYSPLKVAECFQMLATLYPGRIDLGLGRAPGTDPRTSAALQPGPKAYPIDVFPQQIDLLRHFLADDFADDHPYRGIHAMPRSPEHPEMWMLGSSLQGALFAAEFGLPFCHAHFINPGETARVIDLYREKFRPSATLAEPYATLGVAVLAADTDAAAHHIGKSRNLWVTQLLTGNRGRFVSPEAVDDYRFSAQESSIYASVEQRGISGTGETCKIQLGELGQAHGIDEFILLTITYDPADRVRSYELIAQAFDLANPVTQNPPNAKAKADKP